MSGTVFDTYLAALQNDDADVPEDSRKIGVVRRPMPWFHGEVDDNSPELAPPEDLLDEFQERAEELSHQGMEDAAAHNTAMDDIGYDARYLDHLMNDTGAQDALVDVREMLETGMDVTLVCYENTEHKRCHRTLLKRHLTLE